MSLFDTYIGRVGRQLGTNRLFIAATGFFNVGDVSGGADGTDISGMTLKMGLLSPVTRTSFTMASAIQTVSVIPTGYGLVDIYYPSATTSVKLPAALPGAVLILRFGVGAVASNVSFLLGSNSAGSAQSLMYGVSGLSVIVASFNGGASGATLKLICETANLWQVAECNSWNGIFIPQRDA